MMIVSYLGLGSNMGDREAFMRSAVKMLAADPDIDGIRCSSLYETDPVGPVGQASYLNAVLAVSTHHSPRGLLDVCLRVECDLGRVRAVRWGPRVIDVDLLMHGNCVVNDQDLVLPHPRWRQRPFVLVPLSEIVPSGSSLANAVAAALAQYGSRGIRGKKPWHVTIQNGRG